MLKAFTGLVAVAPVNDVTEKGKIFSAQLADLGMFINAHVEKEGAESDSDNDIVPSKRRRASSKKKQSPEQIAQDRAQLIQDTVESNSDSFPLVDVAQLIMDGPGSRSAILYENDALIRLMCGFETSSVVDLKKIFKDISNEIDIKQLFSDIKLITRNNNCEERMMGCDMIMSEVYLGTQMQDYAYSLIQMVNAIDFILNWNASPPKDRSNYIKNLFAKLNNGTSFSSFKNRHARVIAARTELSFMFAKFDVALFMQGLWAPRLTYNDRSKTGKTSTFSATLDYLMTETFTEEYYRDNSVAFAQLMATIGGPVAAYVLEFVDRRGRRLVEQVEAEGA